MKKKIKYYIVNKDVLPEVFLDVVAAKELLEKGKVKTVKEATDKVNISRSSFYKYKDSVFPFIDKSQGQTITILIELEDESGRLSDVLNLIAEAGANVLTINQMIPMHGIAHINICMQTATMNQEMDKLLATLHELDGIRNINVLSKE
ncbi:MAG: ACT domain-containing protein [Epulopiscium sp.]|nr:ACT domain-containing protein [Candidatus Epulonipiscium sp.]